MSLKGYKLIVKKKMQVQNFLLPETPGIKTIISVAWWSKTAFFQTLHITHKKVGYEKATGLEQGMVSGYIMHGKASMWASTQSSCMKTSSSESQSSLVTQVLQDSIRTFMVSKTTQDNHFGKADQDCQPISSPHGKKFQGNIVDNGLLPARALHSDRETTDHTKFKFGILKAYLKPFPT